MTTREQALSKALTLSDEIVGKCEKCMGSGYLEDVVCECVNELRERAIAVMARIPAEYLTYDLKSYPGVQMTPDQKVRADKITGFVDNYLKAMKPTNAQGILFAGPYGCGKTGLACYCMRKTIWRLFPRFIRNTFCTSNELVVAFNQKGKFETRQPNFAMEDFYDGVLCIDDLGKEYAMTWKGVDTDKKMIGIILDELLRARMAKKLVTFATTNFTGTDKKSIWEEIGDSYGASVAETMKLHMRLVKFSDDFPNWREQVSNKANKDFMEEYRV